MSAPVITALHATQLHRTHEFMLTIELSNGADRNVAFRMPSTAADLKLAFNVAIDDLADWIDTQPRTTAPSTITMTSKATPKATLKGSK